MLDDTGKVVMTLAGISTAVLLASQVRSRSEDTLREDFVNVPLRPRAVANYYDPRARQFYDVPPLSEYAQQECLMNPSGDVAFTASASDPSKALSMNLGKSGRGPQAEPVESISYIGAGANLQADLSAAHGGTAAAQAMKADFRTAVSAVPGGRRSGGSRVVGGPVPAGLDVAKKRRTFPTINPAGEIVENYNGPRNSLRKAAHPVGIDKYSRRFKLDPEGKRGACGIEGTTSQYTGQSMVGANFAYPPGEARIESTGESAMSQFPMGDMDGAGVGGMPQSAYMTQRLIYSTLKRREYAQGDPIRGDLAIAPAPQLSKPAAGPTGSLRTGAFAAMFGINAAGPSTAEQTAALVSAGRLGAYTTGGGENLADAVTESQDVAAKNRTPEGISLASFQETTAAAVARGERMLAANSLSGTTQGRAGVNSTTGTVGGAMAPGPLLIGGTSFA